jgi:WXG100 family type VII secretion target
LPSTPGGGDDGLRVDTDTLMSASDQLRSIADDLRDGLSRLMSDADDVVEGSWAGEAATAFAREWDEFRDAAQAIVEDADVIADLVALSMKHYVGRDADGAAMLRSTWLGA